MLSDEKVWTEEVKPERCHSMPSSVYMLTKIMPLNRYSQLYLEYLSRFGRMRVLSRDDQWLRGGIKGSGSSGINRVKSRCG